MIVQNSTQSLESAEAYVKAGVVPVLLTALQQEQAVPTKDKACPPYFLAMLNLCVSELGRSALRRDDRLSLLIGIAAGIILYSYIIIDLTLFIGKIRSNTKREFNSSFHHIVSARRFNNNAQGRSY